MFVSINPMSGLSVAQYAALSLEEAQQRLGHAAQAQRNWAARSFDERAGLMRRIAAELRQRQQALAVVMAQEMGKPLRDGCAEVEKAAWCAEHFADHAAQYLAAVQVPTAAEQSYVRYEPLGVVLSILPWNMPVWLAMRCLAPALMAGNAVAMKPDPHTVGSALGLLSVLEAAGLPSGLATHLPVATENVAPLIADDAVAAVSFTGSTHAGREVAALAGRALKPAVLELGGSDAFVMLADADIEAAADAAVQSRMVNSGQSCVAAKRVIVEAPLYEAALERIQHLMQRLKIGDPMRADTDVGPLAREALRSRLQRQVETSIAAGARCLMGGAIPEGAGYFYPPTLLTEVAIDMPVWREETFGPVLVLVKADDAEHALALAKATEYGLGAAVWTRDEHRARHFIEALPVGQVAINTLVKTDPRLPSGGVKASGLGRELGAEGIRALVNVKQVWWQS